MNGNLNILIKNIIRRESAIEEALRLNNILSIFGVRYVHSLSSLRKYYNCDPFSNIDVIEIDIVWDEDTIRKIILIRKNDNF